MAAQPRTFYELTLDVRYSAFYHSVVHRWFSLLNNATMLVSLVLFSSVLVSLLREVEVIGTTAAALGSLLTAINITYRSVARAQEHRDRYKLYQALDAKLSANALNLQEGEQAYRELEINEPERSERFARIAQVQMLRSYGHEEEAVRIERRLTFIDKAVRWML